MRVRRLAATAATLICAFALVPVTGASPAGASTGEVRDSVLVRGHSSSGGFVTGRSGDWVVSPTGKVLFHQEARDVEGSFRMCGSMVVTSASPPGLKAQTVAWRDLATGRTGTLRTTSAANLLGPAPNGILYASEDFGTTAFDSVVFLRTTDGVEHRLGRVPGWVSPSGAVCDTAGLAVLALPNAAPSPGQQLRLAYLTFSGGVTTLARPAWSASTEVRLLTTSAKSVLWSVGAPFTTATTLYRSAVGAATTTVVTVPKGSALVGAGGSASEIVYTVDDGTAQTATKVASGGTRSVLPDGPFGADSRWWPVPGGFAAAGEDGVWSSTAAGVSRVWQPPQLIADVHRVAGADRYATATALQAPLPGPAVVYIASGATYPDALSGGPAAAAADGTVLLTAPTWLPSTVRAFLTGHHPAEIVVLGGTGAVSSAVETALRAYAPTVRRLSGSDRYATAAAVSRDRFAAGLGGTVVVAPGASNADALSGGPAAAHWGGPLLLTPRTALPASTITELQRLKPDRIVVVGGTGVVSAAVLTALQAYAGTVERVSGADRYATAAALSKKAFPTGAPVAYVASGEDFPDGIAAGAVAGRLGGPVLLTARGALPAAAKTELARLRPDTAVVAGGESVVSRAAFDSVLGVGWP